MKYIVRVKVTISNTKELVDIRQYDLPYATEEEAKAAAKLITTEHTHAVCTHFSDDHRNSLAPITDPPKPCLGGGLDVPRESTRYNSHILTAEIIKES